MTEYGRWHHKNVFLSKMTNEMASVSSDMINLQFFYFDLKILFQHIEIVKPKQVPPIVASFWPYVHMFFCRFRVSFRQDTNSNGSLEYSCSCVNIPLYPPFHTHLCLKLVKQVLLYNKINLSFFNKSSFFANKIILKDV